MAKRKRGEATKEAAKTGGPYLAAAFFCEKVIEDKQDGSMSAIRMIDKMVVNLPPAAAPEFPSKEQPLPIEVTALVAFKTGYTPGRHTIRVEMESPSGKGNPLWERELEFSSEPNSGANIRINTMANIYK